MAQRALNPDGSPSDELDDFRKQKILEREDKGQITPHFHLNEFRTNDARGSAVPVKSWDASIRLCEGYLEPMREKFGACKVVSGYRHRAYNDRISGAAVNSQHIYDETPGCVAADTRYERGGSAEWVAYAKTLREQLGRQWRHRPLRPRRVHPHRQPPGDRGLAGELEACFTPARRRSGAGPAAAWSLTCARGTADLCAMSCSPPLVRSRASKSGPNR